MPSNQKLIAQGAEAKIILKNNTIIKDRIKKSYRLEELDNKIRRRRTKKEAKLLEKATKVIFTPKVIKVSEKDFQITMEYLAGKKLSLHLDKFPLGNKKRIIGLVGELVAILHNNNIIHGDLTTSNMILMDKKDDNSLYFIDFGLGFVSKKVEDKAVDVHLLEQALEAKHFIHFKELRRAFLQGYKRRSKDFQKVLQQLKKVESRGRYRH